MAADYLQLLTRRDTLFALGVSLVVMGVVMRGLAQSNRRDQALRKQHLLESPLPTDEPDRTDRHLEKNLPRYAAACITAGLIMVVAGFFR